MSYPNARGALNQYTQLAVQSNMAEATPHRIIQMLLEGALEKIATAKGHMGRGEIAQKGSHVTWAISIISGLRMSLDAERGGEIARNLDSLYDYMCRQLLKANRENDSAILDEVSGLLREIKRGWDSIPEPVRNAPRPDATAPARAAGT